MLRTAFLALLWAARLASAATLTGRIVDSRTGEPVALAEVVAPAAGRRAVTDSEGRFTLDVPAGDVQLNVTTVGYGLVKRTVQVSDSAEIEIALQQDTAVRRDSVTVSAGPFESRDANPPAQWTLSNREIQALSMVLVGDPLRAAQASPSVTGNNDFRAEFAVRGAAYDRVGVFIDGVLTNGFVHAASLAVGTMKSSEKLSLSVINSDTVVEVSLLPGSFPARYGGGSAAALNLETREGSLVKTSGRFSTGLLSTAAVVDGPFAHHRGSWLLAARSSYADYLQRFIERITGTGRSAADREKDPDSSLNFSDAQAKGSYTLTPHQQAGVSLTYGIFTAKQDLVPGPFDPEELKRLKSENLLAIGYWRYTPGPRFWIEARGFELRDNTRDFNRNEALLDDSRREQSGFRIDSAHIAGAHNLESGVYVRFLGMRRRALGYTAQQPFFPTTLENFDRRSVEDSYYIQDTWKRKTVWVTFGGRVSHSDLTGQVIGAPRASVAFLPRENWTIRLGGGVYTQFPDFPQLFGFFGNRRLRADHATHFDASVERRWGLRTRVLAQFYDREDRRLPFSFSEALLVGGQPRALGLPFRNVLRGHARGGEVTLQRRSANGLTGWLSYGYSRTDYRDATDNLRFPSDFDQRHSLTAAGSYRLRPTWELSSQWRYGSGTPIPGFWKFQGSSFQLAEDRNQARLPYYTRLDVRANKAFLFKRWKLTVSGEVLNVLNRKNQIAVLTDPLRVYSSGRLSATLESSFGVLPCASLAISF